MINVNDIAHELMRAARAKGYASVALTSGLQLYYTAQGDNFHLAIERQHESPAMGEVAECLAAFFPESNNLELEFNPDYRRVDIYRLLE